MAPVRGIRASLVVALGFIFTVYSHSPDGVTTILISETQAQEYSFAKKKSAPEVLLGQGTALSNEELLCSLYDVGGDLESRLSRLDGRKLFRKNYWTEKSAKQKVKKLKKVIKRLKSSDQSDKTKRKLQKTKRNKKKFSQVVKMIKKECGLVVNATPTPTPADDRVRFEEVQEIIETNCMTCHSALGWENTEEFFLNSEPIRVVPGDLENSPFYTFLSNNPEGYLPAYMPKGLAPLNDEDIALLGLWIIDLARPDPNASPQPSDTPNGSPTPVDDLAEGVRLYGQLCASCHMPLDVSQKWGKTADEIRAALAADGVPQMQFLNLSDQDIERIALALGSIEPPIEGTISVQDTQVIEGESTDGSVTLSFQVALNGMASEPFTIGYATSNGSALASSDYLFESGTIQFEGLQNEVQTVEIEVLGDIFEEQNETIFLDIGNSSYYRVTIENTTAVGTILNDDTAPVDNTPDWFNSLLVYHPFDQNFLDMAGGNDAEPRNNPTISSESRIGAGALELQEDQGGSRAGDHLVVPNKALDGLQSFSFNAWVYWENDNRNWTRVFDFGSSSSNYLIFTPRSSTGDCYFRLRANGVNSQVICDGAMPSNQWVHVSANVNAQQGNMELYINGELIGRTNTGYNMTNINTSDNLIGKSRFNSDIDFEGRIDEIYMFDRALTQEEITYLHTSSQTPNFYSGIEVRVGNQVLENGALLTLGEVETGDVYDTSLSISSVGDQVLSLVAAPMVEIGGQHANEFSIQVQPMPWQSMIGVRNLVYFSLRYQPMAPGDKTATLLIPNTDPRHGNYAAGLIANAVGDEISVPEPTDEDVDLAEGQELYALNCSACHGSLLVSQKLGATSQQITNALANIPQMNSISLNADQIAKISLALNTSVNNNGSDVERVTSSIVNIGTAGYVASTLKAIFLPNDQADFDSSDTNNFNDINELILGYRSNSSRIAGRVGFFGGRCDPRFNGSHLCQSESRSVSQRPAPNAIRSGLMLRTCAELLSSDRAVEVALGHAGLDPNSEDYRDPAAMQAVYGLFAPGRQLPSNLADILSNYTSGAPNLSGLDYWRAPLHLFCASMTWEVL